MGKVVETELHAIEGGGVRRGRDDERLPGRRGGGGGGAGEGDGAARALGASRVGGVRERGSRRLWRIGLEVSRKALRAAHAYGADTILLVPSVSAEVRDAAAVGV